MHLLPKVRSFFWSGNIESTPSSILECAIKIHFKLRTASTAVTSLADVDTFGG